MNRHLINSMILCGILGLAGVGCETSRPGVTNSMGRYEEVIEAPTLRASRAAEDVLKSDYKFVLDSSGSSVIDGKVVAHSAQNTTVTIWVKREGENLSRVTVEVDQLSDREHLSLEILDKVKARSKTIVEQIREKLP